MCDGGRVERQYWMRRMEQLRKEMEAEELTRLAKAPTPARPAEPEAAAVVQEPMPA